MKVFYCDACGEKMPDERHMVIPMTRFDNGEKFNIKCFDDCGHSQADVCKECETFLKDAIYRTIYDVISERRSKNNDVQNN